MWWACSQRPHTFLKLEWNLGLDYSACSIPSWQKPQESNQYIESGCGTIFVSVSQKSWMFLPNAVIYEPFPRGFEPRGDVRVSRLSGHRRRFVHTSRRRRRKHNICTFLRSLWWKCAVEVQRQQTRYRYVVWQQSNGQPTPSNVRWGKTCDPPGHPKQHLLFVMDVFI